MSDAFEKFAKLREIYDDPKDLERIGADENALKELLIMKEYSENEGTQQLLTLARTEILTCRKALATKRDLTEEQRKDLWFIIESRLWFVELVAKNYQQELELMEKELDAELQA